MPNENNDQPSFIASPSEPADLFLRMTFNRKYFALAVILFVTEVAIAVFVKDAFIRPYFGDFLVVMLVYCSVKAFFGFSYSKVAVGTLLFSYVLEALQYLHIVDRLALQDNVWARTAIGYGFDPLDLLAYTLGILTVLLLERQFRNKRRDNKRK